MKTQDYEQVKNQILNTVLPHLSKIVERAGKDVALAWMNDRLSKQLTLIAIENGGPTAVQTVVDIAVCAILTSHELKEENAKQSQETTSVE